MCVHTYVTYFYLNTHGFTETLDKLFSKTLARLRHFQLFPYKEGNPCSKQMRFQDISPQTFIVKIKQENGAIKHSMHTNKQDTVQKSTTEKKKR